ncbi:YraN family protein, partial [Bacillus sp. S34]|nr:YraN family protein [Bacillus sp. S34]
MEDHGFRVLERNWRCARGEVDIIAWQSCTLVFIEVKTRAGNSTGHPFEAITASIRIARADTSGWSSNHAGTRRRNRLTFDAVIDLAAATHALVEEHPDLVLVAPTQLSTVLFRWQPAGVTDDEADALVAPIRAALLAEAGEGSEVRDPVVERELVHLEVARVQDPTGGGRDRDGEGVRDGVGDGDERDRDEARAVRVHHPDAAENVAPDVQFLSVPLRHDEL